MVNINFLWRAHLPISISGKEITSPSQSTAVLVDIAVLCSLTGFCGGRNTPLML